MPKYSVVQLVTTAEVLGRIGNRVVIWWINVPRKVKCIRVPLNLCRRPRGRFFEATISSSSNDLREISRVSARRWSSWRIFQSSEFQDIWSVDIDVKVEKKERSEGCIWGSPPSFEISDRCSICSRLRRLLIEDDARSGNESVSRQGLDGSIIIRLCHGMRWELVCWEFKPWEDLSLRSRVMKSDYKGWTWISLDMPM